MAVKVTNNGYGTLSASITTTATTITLDSGQGARFPTLGAGDYFYATLIDSSNNLEVVKVTARSTDSMTVVRGQDNTTAASYSIGDRFELRPTAALFEAIIAEGLPSQTGNSGKHLTTNGTAASWETLLTRASTAPSSPTAGDFWYDTTDKVMKHYDGTNWLQMSNKFSATGGTVTESGGYKIHTFTSSGTFIANGSGEVEYLVIAGGGGGGGWGGAGGGAGGYRTATGFSVTAQSYTVTVGAGGSGTTASVTTGDQTSGTNSVFSTITSLGGGYGGDYSGALTAGANGGSGGGEGYNGGIGTGTAGQGNNGGAGMTTPNYVGGGGGGAGGAGTGGSSGGTGGVGTSSSITGSSVGRAGGGGGGSVASGAGGTASDGGGAGGAGGAANAGGNGTANTGGGGGGSGSTNTGGTSHGAGGNGGSGVVIIRYPV